MHNFVNGKRFSFTAIKMVTQTKKENMGEKGKLVKAKKKKLQFGIQLTKTTTKNTYTDGCGWCLVSGILTQIFGF